MPTLVEGGAVFLELLSGSLSVLCVFGAIVMYGEREDWPLVGSVVTGLFATALWAVGALYVGFAVSGLSACLG